MARRGRKPKFKFDVENYSGLAKSIISLLLVAIGVISFLAICAGLVSESYSSGLGNLLYEKLGLSTLILSLTLAYLGALILGTLSMSFLNYRVFTGLTAFWIGFLGIFSSGSFGEKFLAKTASVISYPGAYFLYFFIAALGVFIVLNKELSKVVEYPLHILNFILEKIFKISLHKPTEGDVEETEEPLLLESPEASTEEKKYNIVQNMLHSDINSDEVEPVQSSFDFDTAEYHKNHQSELSSDKSFEILEPPSAPIGEDEIDFEENSLAQPDYENEEEEVEIEAKADQGIPKLPFSNKIWEYPSLDLLSNAPNQPADVGNPSERAKAIEQTLEAFGIKASVVDIHPGPSVTQYVLNLPIGTKASKIQNLTTDLALRIKSPSGSVRVVAPIPGTSYVGVEVPNNSPSTVSLRSVLMSPDLRKHKNKLMIAMGMDIQGNAVIQDIAKWPHALVAGATGSGKSVMLNAIIASLLFRCSPSECKFIMIDPKMVEMVQYNGIPHLLTPVVTDVEQKAVSALAWAVSEMERRYKVFSAAGVRNIEAYNQQSGFQAEPYIVIIIDELADMMMSAPADVEKYIARLAQKSRATGIHLIIATQRPSVNVLTGIIKANVPTRLAFKVTSNVDSRVIIDQSGAETLIGRGDMLFVPPNDSKASRVQGVWVSDGEINALVGYLKSMGIEPDYKEEITQQKVLVNSATGLRQGGSGDGLDEKTIEALEIVINEGKASASYLQRRLSLGYSKAARIIDEMEAAGIIGRSNGSKPRDVLIGSVENAIQRMSGKGTGDEE